MKVREERDAFDATPRGVAPRDVHERDADTRDADPRGTRESDAYATSGLAGVSPKTIFGAVNKFGGALSPSGVREASRDAEKPSGVLKRAPREDRDDGDDAGDDAAAEWRPLKFDGNMSLGYWNRGLRK